MFEIARKMKIIWIIFIRIKLKPHLSNINKLFELNFHVRFQLRFSAEYNDRNLTETSIILQAANFTNAIMNCSCE